MRSKSKPVYHEIIKKWNAKAKKLMGSSPATKEVNRNLEMIKKNVYRAYQEMMDKQQVITAMKIRNRYLGKDGTRKHILEVIEEHNIKMAKLVGKDYTARTLQRYKTTKRDICDFNNATYSILPPTGWTKKLKISKIMVLKEGRGGFIELCYRSSLI